MKEFVVRFKDLNKKKRREIRSFLIKQEREDFKNGILLLIEKNPTYKFLKWRQVAGIIYKLSDPIVHEDGYVFDPSFDEFIKERVTKKLFKMEFLSINT